ncbi:hypothetical protein A2765_00460 [Candidatus Kaiserbacteria bacterium RIFCSPHIGHO2_01_FULL_56_24]|uniref:Glycine-rich domain-containing protein n=1 Tax=Candidatus Kaiserbacteria bacterium RIFCSPHIGHO2_01_FULL_56_24 TaxID=1798487 RepID=A0A1F6DBP4_9BACT|nr:MAG: hypothetical protein A2765_00460 [Candidatus Kaiserbacteria bacterium RIFCSPHIGHO2_01_FULL_56_24]
MRIGISSKASLAMVVATSILFIGAVAFAAIVSGTSTTNISSYVTITQLTINKPTVSAGDMMLASIAVKDGSVVNVIPPSGWTQIARTDNGVNIALISYWKVATASEPTTYTWTIDQQTKAVGGITPYSGVDTANPIDTVAGNIGLGTLATTSVITTSVANEEVVALYATDVNRGFSTPTGMTAKYNLAHTGGPSTAAYEILQATAGTASSRSSTITGNRARNWAAQQIALRPAPVYCTGGTITTSGGLTIHTFTADETFDCSATGGKTASVLVVGGGGGGATYGGGGGGGYIYDASHSVAAQAYSVTVGAGGAKGTHIGSVLTDGSNGGNSFFDTMNAVGGGGGGSGGLGNPGLNGGSGGGGGGYNAGVSASGGSGTAGQGNSGGSASGSGSEYGGGGGGAGGAGSNGSGSSGGIGGIGVGNSISGSLVTYAAGGAGKGATGATAANATANTGSGGDASPFDGGGGSAGGDGGSGIVIISY